MPKKKSSYSQATMVSCEPTHSYLQQTFRDRSKKVKHRDCLLKLGGGKK